MTNQEAIKVMLDNLYKKVKHRLFASDEYIYSKGDKTRLSMMKMDMFSKIGILTVTA